MSRKSEESVNLTEKLYAYLRTRPEIQLGYLFGSQAFDQANPLSDIDVAILVDEIPTEENYPYGYKARIGTELMSLLKTNKIDLVVLNRAPYFLRHRVISKGRPVFIRSEERRILFEADVMSRYPDIKRLLQTHLSPE